VRDAQPGRRAAVVGQGGHHDLDLVDLRRPTAARLILQGADPARVVAGPPVHHRRPRRSGPRAISAFGNPSAANNTIRARNASPARIELDRSSPSNRGRSPSRRTRGAATDMLIVPHH
jgi:hypothetical protein